MSIAFGGALLPRVEAFTLGVVLLTACVMDLRTRRIPNGLVVVGALAGVGFALLDGGLGGGVRAVAGLTVGLLVWLPFWLLRMLGGGDVNLFAAGAAWLGPTGAIEAAMIAGLSGGVLSLLYLAQRLRLQVVVRVEMDGRGEEVQIIALETCQTAQRPLTRRRLLKRLPRYPRGLCCADQRPAGSRAIVPLTRASLQAVLPAGARLRMQGFSRVWRRRRRHEPNMG